MSILEAARSGDRRKALEASRDALAAAMDAAEPSVIAQLAGQLRAVLKELAEMPEPVASSPLVKASQKRANRRANLKAV